jgi:hypothetical protein
MDIDYKQKILKYKQKYLNLKNNTMKGGEHMEIVLNKIADGTINFSLPSNLSSAAPGTYKFEHDIESVASEIVRVVYPPAYDNMNSYEILKEKNLEYLRIFQNSIIEKIRLDKDLFKIWENSVARSVFIFLMRQIYKCNGEEYEQLILKKMSENIRAYEEFIFDSQDSKYKSLRDTNSWSEYQIELNKILDDPEKNKGIIDSFKTVFNKLTKFCV